MLCCKRMTHVGISLDKQRDVQPGLDRLYSHFFSRDVCHNFFRIWRRKKKVFVIYRMSFIRIQIRGQRDMVLITAMAVHAISVNVPLV